MPSPNRRPDRNDSDPLRWRPFWITLLLTVLGGGIATVVLNALVDPTGAVHAAWPDAPRICEPGPRGDVWLAATLPVRLDPPDLLVAGTSHMSVGMDQALVNRLANGGKARIIGLVGSRMTELARWIVPLIDRPEAPERLILGVDYSMFSGVDRRPGARPPEGLTGLWTRILLHPNATKASLGAIGSQKDCALSRSDEAGGDRGRSIMAAAADVGWETYRRRADMTLMHRLSLIDATRMPGIEDVAALDAVLAMARARGTAVTLLVPPRHPALREAYVALNQTGGISRFLDLLADRARADGVDVLDLSAADIPTRMVEHTTEPGFLDIIHFTPPLLAPLINK
jgi:hypothetical protein